MHSTNSSSIPLLAKLFIAALATRWCYDVALYLAMGDNGLMGVDSFDYLHRAQVFVTFLTGERTGPWDWFGGDPMQTPLFTWLTTLSVLAFPSSGPLAYVLAQGVLDSATCLLIFQIASARTPRI